MNRRLPATRLLAALLACVSVCRAEPLSCTTLDIEVDVASFRLELEVSGAAGQIVLQSTSKSEIVVETNIPDLSGRKVFGFPVSALIQIRDREKKVLTPGDLKWHPGWSSVRLFASDFAYQDPRARLTMVRMRPDEKISLSFDIRLPVERIIGSAGQFQGAPGDAAEVRIRIPVSFRTSSGQKFTVFLESFWMSVPRNTLE